MKAKTAKVDLNFFKANEINKDLKSVNTSSLRDKKRKLGTPDGEKTVVNRHPESNYSSNLRQSNLYKMNTSKGSKITTPSPEKSFEIKPRFGRPDSHNKGEEK